MATGWTFGKLPLAAVAPAQQLAEARCLRAGNTNNYIGSGLQISTLVA